MKKFLALLLVSVMCLSFVACSNQPTDENTPNENVEYNKLGDTVSTDIFEFTLNSAEFTIALNNITDDSYYTAKDYDSQTDADNPYVAPVGHTYCAFSYTVNNLNRASSEFHKGSFATVKYDGKEYNSMEDGAYFLYADKQVMDSSGSLRTEKAGEWHSDPGSNFLLMTGAKETRRAHIDIATDIKDLTSDVEITVSVPNSDGTKTDFTYLVTESDRASSDNTEIEMSLDLALVSFTEDAGQEYFAKHLQEYEVISGNQIGNIVTSGKWEVDYIIEGMGHWSGTFWFEDDGQIKDTYGYANERTWEVAGDTIIIDGETSCEMRKVTDGVYLLVSNGKPYMLMQ